MNRRDLLKKLGVCCVATPFLLTPNKTNHKDHLDKNGHQLSMGWCRAVRNIDKLLVDCASDDENVSRRSLQILTDILQKPIQYRILKETQLALQVSPHKFKILLYGTNPTYSISKKYMREARWDIVCVNIKKLIQMTIDKLNVEKDLSRYDRVGFRLHRIELSAYVLHPRHIGFDLYCCGSGA